MTVSMCVHMGTCAYMCACACTCVCVHARACTDVCACSTFVCVCVRVCACVHTLPRCLRTLLGSHAHFLGLEALCDDKCPHREATSCSAGLFWSRWLSRPFCTKCAASTFPCTLLLRHSREAATPDPSQRRTSIKGAVARLEQTSAASNYARPISDLRAERSALFLGGLSFRTCICTQKASVAEDRHVCTRCAVRGCEPRYFSNARHCYIVALAEGRRDIVALAKGRRCTRN